MSFERELLYGWRRLRSSPAFTLCVVVTLGLAIGVSTAVFSVFNGVLLRPLDYEEAGDLVKIWSTDPESGQAEIPVDPYDFSVWSESNSTFEKMAAYGGWSGFIRGSEETWEVRGHRATCDFFRVLRQAPALGRLLDPADCERGAEPVAVIGHGLWQRVYGGDPAIVGRVLTFKDESFRVVGVAAESFDFDSGAQFWTPLIFEEESLQTRQGGFLFVVARLKPEVSLKQSQLNLNAVAARGQKQDEEYGVRAVLLHEEIVGRTRQPLVLVFVTVVVVFLIACFNVASVLVTRSLEVRSYAALRAALGASPMQLLRLHLVESLLLSILAGALGLMAAWVCLQLILPVIPSGFPRLDAIRIDGSVLAFLFLLTLVTAGLCTLLPAPWALRNLRAWLGDAGGVKKGTVKAATRQRLLTAQLTTAFVLLVGAGLVSRDWLQLRMQDPGLNPEGILTVNLRFDQFYQVPQRVLIYQEALNQLKALPGVRSATLGTNFPGSRTSAAYPVELEGGITDARYRVQVHWAAPDYFEVMQIPILEGRTFSAGETGTVALVNESAARRLWPGRTALGQSIRVLRKGQSWKEVIGVVGGVRHFGPTREVPPEIYLPFSQADQIFVGSMLVLRTETAPTQLLPIISKRLRESYPNITTIRTATMSGYLQQAVERPRFLMVLLNAYGAFGFLIAIVAVYGMVSYVTALRKQELGIRKALGAQRSDLRRLVMGSALGSIAWSLLFGLLISGGLMHLLTGYLHSVSPVDPTTYLAVVATFVSVSLLSSYLPSRRIERIEPTSILRYQ
ncbi:MAG TPA: ABC transporter permease [Acidobacteriota bacterium]|nr:ABC transporter permease [Acidobacteriota bacterium]